MAKVERTVIINAPVDKVFTYIGDPMSEVEWLPSIIEVKDVKLTEEGVGSTYRWAYKLAGIRFEGEGTTTEYVPNRRIVVESRGGIVSTWTYTFAPHDGGTRLNLVVEFTIPVPALGRLAQPMLLRQSEREADSSVENLKAVLEK
jgi:uncharacterized membrane protein